MPGGDLTAHVPTSGTIAFDDPDLTDTHTVSVKLLLDGLDLPPTPLKIFEHALTASIATDSTGSGLGTIKWQLADLPVYLGDFIPKGETITLTYAVTVTDSQGATATQDITVTITGTDTPAVVWIATTTTGSPPGGLWSNALDWETGTVPTATDDAIIITDQLIGLTPSYPVTIDANTAAAAKSVTMNDYGTSPPELINLGSLAVGGAFDMSADSILHNSGTVSVGGLMEVLNTSVLLNSGGIALWQGGDFSGHSTITNTSKGLIEVGGGTLNVGVDIANAGQVAIDSNATLKLNNATIDGGAIIDRGMLDLTGNAVVTNGTLYNVNQVNVSGTGNAFVNETIYNGSLSIPALFYNLQPVVNNAFFDDPGPGGSIFTLEIATVFNDAIDVTGTLTLNGATISGGAVADNGTIDVTGDSTITGASLIGGSLIVESGQTLTLDGTSLTGSFVVLPGEITEGAVGITQPPGVAVDPVGVYISGSTITDDGTIKIDANNGIWLANVAISGGKIANSGSIEIVGSSSIENDALNNHQLTVDSSQTLTLDGTEIIGGTITDNGTIHVTGASKIDGNAALDNGIVTVDAVLTLDNVTVSGTTINDNAGIELDGTVKLSGGASIQGTLSETLGVVTNNGTLEVAGPATLLDDTLTNTSAGIIQVDSDDTLTLSGVHISGGTINDGTADGAGGAIDVTGDSTISDANLNHGSVKISQGVTLTLDDVTVTGTSFTDTTSGSVIQVDDSTTLTLSGVHVTGGTVNDGTADGTGSIDITGDSTISQADLNHGAVTLNGVTLTLDNDTVTGTSFTDKADGSVIQVDDSTTLTLSGVHITGGTVNDGTADGAGGNIDVTADSAISGANLNHGAVTLNGVKLTLDNDTVTGTSFTDTADGSVIQVDDSTTLTLSGVHVTSGTINDGTADGTGGNIDVTADSAISGANLNHGAVTLGGVTLTLDNDTVTGTSFTDTTSGSVIQVDDSTTLTLSGVHITGGTINDGTADGTGGNIDVTADSAISGASLNYGRLTIGGGATLTLDDGVTISSGTLTIDQFGVLDVVHGTAGAAVTLDGSVTNAGLLEATSGGMLQIDGNVTNSGTIEANGGTLVVGADASISGSPAFTTVTITGNGLADFVGTATQTLALNATFSGSGTLELDNSQHYGGTVSGFVTGDKIDLTDLAYSSSETDVWNSLTHTLTITEGTQSSNIIFSGSYDQNSFALTNDGNGDTEVVLSPAQASVSGLDHAGNAVEGFALDATLTDLNASGVTYQWLDNGTEIATGSIYTPTAAGQTLDVVVGFTDGSAEHVTALAGAVVAPPSVVINADDTTINENASLTLNTLHASFADAGSDSFTVTLDVIHGTLALDSMVGVSESGAGTSASPFILTGTLADIDTALTSGLVYTPTTGYYGPDTLTFEVNDGTFGSNTATAAITVTPLPPVLHSMTLTVAQGGTDVLTNADFSVTDPNSSSFLYTVGNVTGGQFEVFNGNNWVSAPTGGFTTAQIAAGQVEFVQDGSTTPPSFSIFASDGISASSAIAPTVNFNDGPTITTANVALAAASLWGDEGEHQGAAITYADGHLYLSYNNGPETEGTSDTATVVGFNTEPSGISGFTFAFNWNYGDFFGLAADGNQIYAVGESNPGDGLTSDDIGGVETKSIFVRFDTNATSSFNEPFGDTAHTFYSYSGVESFQNAIVTTHGENTSIYAFGFGQPNSYGGYIIGEYNSSGTLLATATDPGGVPGSSSANGAVDWEGAIWAVGSSQHGSEAYASPTVWTFSYDLSQVSIHEDNIGGAGIFNGVTTIGGLLYAAGTAYVDGGQDYLIAEYNNDGSVAWSDTFGAAGAISTLNGIVEINGRLFVAGSESIGGVTEGVVMEINASNGAVISTLTSDPGLYNAFTSIASDGQHLFVAGVYGSSVSQDQAILVTYDIGGPAMTTVEDRTVSTSSIAVSAAAAGSAQIEVTLALGHGSLVLESGSGLDSIVGAGTGSIELFGSQAAINAALAHGLVYDPVANYTGSDTLMITVNDQGHNATSTALSTTQEVSIAVTPADSIADGATYTVSTATGDTIAFATGSGTLDLVQHASFSGEIAGISGTGDVIEIPGFTASTTTAVTGSGSYDSTTNTTSLGVIDTAHGIQGLTLVGDYSGSTWTVTDDGHGGVNVADPPAPAAAAIATGSSLEISTAASTENITFQGSTGSLTLDHPANFTGVVSGFTGNGTLSGSDHIDLKGIDYNSHSFTESYNATNDTLSVSDGTNSAVLHFNGIYQAANFSFTTDNAGGTIVYDPPVPDHSAAKTQTVTATTHGFVFNFAEHGNIANGAHPAGDTHIFDGQTFVNAEADLNKHHDDGHGHAASAFDSPEPATIAAIKAQLHAHDFHFV
ncbi:cadherin-like domain-containing protein [Bradyrhizobium sp. S69]|uniref:beta strand repeat-containing protein n=1 Tax=Bradyrhizobium sp. S69 TaxID=1641856 RepID=UPI001AEEA2B4|nr:cadherin-like domain-containing protein [Bradyrhizobium sp. S69]